MSDFENKESRSVLRRPAAIASALVFLAVGVAYTLRSPTNNNVIIQQWEKARGGGQDTGSGIVVAKMTSSGSLTLSGSLKVADQRTGSGKITIGGTDGSGICGLTTAGACACIDFIVGNTVTRAAPASECEQ